MKFFRSPGTKYLEFPPQPSIWDPRNWFRRTKKQTEEERNNRFYEGNVQDRNENRLQDHEPQTKPEDVTCILNDFESALDAIDHRNKSNKFIENIISSAYEDCNQVNSKSEVVHSFANDNEKGILSRKQKNVEQWILTQSYDC